MLDAIIRFSLKYRLLIVIVSLAVLLYGGYVTARLPIDVLPDLDRPRVVLLTEAPGFAAEEVEPLIRPPSATAGLGAAGVQAVRSQSVAGLNVIYVEFDWSMEVRAARQIVQERIATLAGVLPEKVTPYMAPSSSILGQIVIAGLYRQRGPEGGRLFPVPKTQYLIEFPPPAGGKPAALIAWKVADRRDQSSWERVPVGRVDWAGVAPPEADDEAAERKARVTIAGEARDVALPSAEQQSRALRTLAEWVVRPRLRKIPGVSEVFVQGGDRLQYQGLADPALMLEYSVSLQQVEQALKDNNVSSTGGFAIRGDTERPIRVLGRLGPDSPRVLSELKKIPVKTTERRTILVEQVATVAEGSAVKRGDGAVNGIPGVVLTVAKQPHVDTRKVTDEITEALTEAEASMGLDVVADPSLFQLKRFIDNGIYNVGEALVIGAVLVLIVLFLFLLNFRTTFITLSAIPLSLMITALTFRVIGWLTGTQLSINVMTLGGIAVAMGELVDDAVVDVENIFRRLKENNNSASPRAPLQVVFEASKEIRGAIVFGTMVVILVFLPLFALPGVPGRLFQPLAVAYIVSILASLAVSLTVTPVLSYYLLPQSGAAHHEKDGTLVRLLKWGASFLIRFSMLAATPLLLLTWAAVALSVVLLLSMGQSFLPDFDEGSVQVSIGLPPGSSLQASNDMAAIVDRKLRGMRASPTNPRGELRSFVRRTGRAELDEHAMPVSASEYILSINPDSGRSREEIINGLRDDLKKDVPGAALEIEQPLMHLISHMLSGVTSKIAIKIYGEDLDQLVASAEKIKAAIADVPGVTDLEVEQLRKADELHIRLRPDDLAFYGVSRAYVAEFVRTAMLGEPVSQVVEGQRRFDLVVRLEEASRTDYTRLGELRLDLPDGRGQVKLAQLADVGDDAGPNGINREDARRRLVIKCNVRDRDLVSVVDDIRKRVDERVKLPEGMYPTYGGQFQSQQEASYVVLGLGAVSLVGMFVVLMILYLSVRITLQILNALPTAFVGGVVALWLSGQPLTVASMVGFISLGGIAVRNGILLVTHYFHLMKFENESFTKAMVLRGSLERLSPVLMTALTAGIGLVPLVLAGNEPGREILYPVATVILGGLVTSTFCEFLIHPGLFWRFSGKDADRLAHTEDEDEKSLGRRARVARRPGTEKGFSVRLVSQLGGDWMTSICKWAAVATVLAALGLVAGCGEGAKDKGKPADKAAKGDKDKGGKEEHASEGPHKGALAEWGNEEYHAEFTVDHKTKSVKVYILGPDAKTTKPIKADKVTLSIKKPAFQVELKADKQPGDPEGTASAFAGKDDRFGVEQEFEGTISAEVGGKQYAGDFKEKDDHDHKKK
ncbi:MAG: efflux RND transporter permease subunit [Gemmataceae bacterium]